MPSAYPTSKPLSINRIILGITLFILVIYIFKTSNSQEPTLPPSPQHSIPQPSKPQQPQIPQEPQQPQKPQQPLEPQQSQQTQTQQQTQQTQQSQKCELGNRVMPKSYSDKLVFPPPPSKFRSCKDIAQALLDQKPPEVKAPETYPPEMKKDYTLDGAIAEAKMYFSNVYNGAAAMIPIWEIEKVNELRAKVAKKELLHYAKDTMSIYKALDKWGLETVWEQTGIVIGSEDPWVESTLLEYGAKHVTTIEYGKIESRHPQISTILPSQSYTLLLHGKWALVDFAFSFSSIEHSGLGRYGDPLDPFGDLEAMQQISCLVKPGGFLFLGFPVGPDCLVFNAHRIKRYGPKRLEKIFEGWHVLDMIVDTDHVDDLVLDNNSATKCVHGTQPVIVMQNLRGCDVKA